MAASGSDFHNKLNRSIVMAKASIPYFTIEEFKKWVDYDPVTGETRWSSEATVKPSFIGKPLPKNGHGYVMAMIRGHRPRKESSKFTIHRLIYGAYVLGYWPPVDMEIDHINGVRDDNRLENLRMVTLAENTKNAKLRADNRTGHAGVSKVVVKGKTPTEKDHIYWRAGWKDQKTGKQRAKNFPYTDEGLKAAIEFRKHIFETVLVPAGYHESHGIPQEMRTNSSLPSQPQP